MSTFYMYYLRTVQCVLPDKNDSVFLKYECSSTFLDTTCVDHLISSYNYINYHRVAVSISIEASQIETGPALSFSYNDVDIKL